MRALGLCGREALEILKRIIEAPILRQLRVLRVDGGWAGPDCASWVRDHAAAFAHLELHTSSERFIPVYE